MFQTDQRREPPTFTNRNSACQARLRDLTFALSGPKTRQHARVYGRGKQWQKTARQLDDQFDTFLRTFGLPFKTWAENSVGERYDPETVFYPFGGPDFCFPYYLSPNAREYILVGFEPCSLWPLDALSPAFEFGDTLEAMRHYLCFSYFITKDLHRSLAATNVRSVLPLLLTQIARCGLPLLSLEFIDGAEGLCIEFGERDDPRRLHYFRQDLRDGHWSESSSLHRRLLAAKGLAVFVKSASYLLHEPPFERLRQVIRDHASVLVQDPSGVPYDLLKTWRWSVGLHGQFTSDIPVFSRYDQSSLARAYLASKDSRRLDFGIGYLTTPSASSLIVASPPERAFVSHQEVSCAS
ncbi:hypothetical protein [Hyphomicrobium facile]|uniref:Uncharacterized protein n=1 Tax=Hyphomicrobium facile TaxID=51670 RepID=A0A1I7N4H1_9HYPH|nr:hypothetical protein [Hyphomicrobium facile]SFV29496.1 hypothetical protein SAMN04488557_1265 [Hyphomicrobium facile]